MWKILRDKYMVIVRRYVFNFVDTVHHVDMKLCTCITHILRDTVMELMRLLDPKGVVLRRSRRLQRRVYTSKVIF